VEKGRNFCSRERLNKGGKREKEKRGKRTRSCLLGEKKSHKEGGGEGGGRGRIKIALFNCGKPLLGGKKKKGKKKERKRGNAASTVLPLPIRKKKKKEGRRKRGGRSFFCDEDARPILPIKKGGTYLTAGDQKKTCVDLALREKKGKKERGKGKGEQKREGKRKRGKKECAPFPRPPFVRACQRKGKRGGGKPL